MDKKIKLKRTVRIGKSDSFKWFKIKITEKRGYEKEVTYVMDIKDHTCQLSVNKIIGMIKKMVRLKPGINRGTKCLKR